MSLRSRLDRAARPLSGGRVPILFCLSPSVPGEEPAYTLDGEPVTAEEVRARYGGDPAAEAPTFAEPVVIRFIHEGP